MALCWDGGVHSDTCESKSTSEAKSLLLQIGAAVLQVRCNSFLRHPMGAR